MKTKQFTKTPKNQAFNMNKMLKSVIIFNLLFFTVFSSQAQTAATNTITVKGTVVDMDNLPIENVNITLRGSAVGVATNFDGYFEFPKTLKNGDILTFSHVSFKSKKVTINNSLTLPLQIQMELDDSIMIGNVSTKKVYKSKPKN